MKIDIRTAVDEAGSPTKLALMMGLDKRRGGQRVSQWLHRQAVPPDAQRDFYVVWRRLADRIKRRTKRLEQSARYWE